MSRYRGGPSGFEPNHDESRSASPRHAKGHAIAVSMREKIDSLQHMHHRREVKLAAPSAVVSKGPNNNGPSVQELVRRLELVEGLQRQADQAAEDCSKRVAECEHRHELVRRLEHAEGIQRKTEDAADACFKLVAECERRQELLPRLEHAEGIQRQTESVADACSKRVAEYERRLEQAEGLQQQADQAAEHCSKRVAECEHRIELLLRLEHAEGIQRQTEEAADGCSKRLADCERRVPGEGGDLRQRVKELEASEEQLRQQRDVQQREAARLKEQLRELKEGPHYHSTTEHLNVRALEHQNLGANAEGLEPKPSRPPGGEADAFIALHPDSHKRLHAHEQSRLAMERRIEELESRGLAAPSSHPGGDHEHTARELRAMLDHNHRLLQDVSKEKESQVTALEAEIATLRAKLARLREQQAEVERSSEMKVQDVTQALSLQLADRDQEIAGMRSRIAELDSGAPSPRPQIHELQQHHAREVRGLREKHEAEMEALRSRVAKKERVIADLDAGAAELEVLRSRLAEAERAPRETEALRQKVRELEHQHAVDVAALERQLVAEHEDKYAGLHVAREQLQRDHGELQIRHRDLQDQFRTLQAQRQGPSPEEHEELSRQLSQARQQLELEQEERLAAVQTSRQQVQYLNEQLAAAQEEVVLKQEQADGYALQFARLEDEHRQRLDEARLHAQELAREKEQLHTTLAELQKPASADMGDSGLVIQTDLPSPAPDSILPSRETPSPGGRKHPVLSIRPLTKQPAPPPSGVAKTTTPQRLVMRDGRLQPKAPPTEPVVGSVKSYAPVGRQKAGGPSQFPTPTLTPKGNRPSTSAAGAATTRPSPFGRPASAVAPSRPSTSARYSGAGLASPALGRWR